MAKTYINGQAFSGVQMEAMFANQTFPFAELLSVDWDKERVKENNYGNGSEPTSFSIGQANYTASIEITMDDLVKLRKEAPEGDITLLPPADFIIMYANGVKTTSITLENAQFKKDMGSHKRDDMRHTSTLDLLISGVKHK